ncbi:unnamed protein product [Clonostachys byssicola]|uniref:Uncharacterized protein n=1 Tax=Clonostachys byssicola TaxID=160290 RepID=A0A9N9UDL3_9HYPO|nr:unnamed protein product [Clonostachys byssicola]
MAITSCGVSSHFNSSVDVALLINADELFIPQHGEPDVAFSIYAPAIDLDHFSGGVLRGKVWEGTGRPEKPPVGQLASRSNVELQEPFAKRLSHKQAFPVPSNYQCVGEDDVLCGHLGSTVCIYNDKAAWRRVLSMENSGPRIV